MGFIEMPGLGDINELEVQPEGEYDLVVDDVLKYTKEDTENDVIRLRLAFDGNADASTFNHYLSLPGPQDDQDKVKNKMRSLKRFLLFTGVPFDASGFNEEDLQGLMFKGRVVQEARTDANGNETGDMQNRLIVPRFDNE